MKIMDEWKQLSIRMKMFSGFLVVVFLATVSMFILNTQLLHVVRNNEEILKNYVPKLSIQYEVKSTIMEQINDVLLYFTINEEKYKQQFYQSIEYAKKLNGQLLEGASESEKPEIEKVIYQTKTWELFLKDQVLPVYHYGNKEPAIEILHNSAIPIALDLMKRVDSLSKNKRTEISSMNEKNLDHAWSSVVIGYVIIGVTLLFAILFSFYASRNMTNPIVDELKRANKKLQEESERAKESTRLKSEFLANITHELRTPLTAIIGYAELMEGTEKYSHQEKLFSHNIVNAAEHLLTMINDLLDLSKIEAGKYELDLELFDIKNTMVTAVNLLQTRAASRKISLNLMMPDQPCPIVGDEKRVLQVLLNLVVNAIKFSHEGGTVRIRLNKEDNFMILQVEDQGIGIDKEKQNKIFDQFYQSDGSLGRQYDGSGLGLTLSKQLVELHGGTVHVESELGKGSIFTVNLPSTQCIACSKLGDEEEKKILLYTKDCRPYIPEIFQFFQEKCIPLQSKIEIEDEQSFDESQCWNEECNHIVLAGESYNENFLEIVKALKKISKGKLSVYIHQPLRLTEKGRLMGLVNEVFNRNG